MSSGGVSVSQGKDGPCVEGYLKKKATTGMQQWQLRYFVGKKGKLVYWKSEQERRATGSNYKTISLRGGVKIKKVRKDSANSDEFIIYASEKQYHLRANTAKEMSTWREQLLEVMNYKKQQKARNTSMVASAAAVPFIESSMQVTLPGMAPKELYVRVDKMDRKMTFAESEQRMLEGKATAAASLMLANAQLSKHGSKEFRLHVSVPTRRTYSFQLAEKADRETWVSALLLLDITFMSRGDAEKLESAGGGGGGGGVAAPVKASSRGHRRGNSGGVPGTQRRTGSNGGGGAKAGGAKAGADPGPSTPARAIAAADWIQEYDALVGDRKRSDAVMVAFTLAERFFQPGGGSAGDGDQSVREVEELDVHDTVECAERLIDDLNMRYNDCAPDRLDLFELYLAQYNNRLITQLDMLGISDPDCLEEYTPEELKKLIQLLTTYLVDVVYPAIEGTTIAQRVLVDKFETDKQVLIEAYTDKALAIITDILRRSAKKLLTKDPAIYAQSRSAIVRTVTVTDIFRVVLKQLEICEECEVVDLNNNMLFSCVKAVQTYTLVVASYLPVIAPDMKFLCAAANDFMSIREELLKLLHEKRAGDCGYNFEDRLRTLGISASDPHWAEKMYAQSKDLDDIFADLANGQAVAIHALLDDVLKPLRQGKNNAFAEFFNRFDRHTPYDLVFNQLKDRVLPRCAEYFGTTENMKLLLQLCADHCQINYYQALFAKIRSNDDIKGKFWLKKFGLNTERIGRESQGEDFFRYFLDVNASRLRNAFRALDVDEQGSLSLRTFMETLHPYLPEGRDAPFKDWVMEQYCSQKNKDTSKSRIDYPAFTQRIMQMEAQHEATRRGAAANGHGAKTHRSLVADFHKFEDFFRGRVVQYLPQEKGFFSRCMVPRLNVFKDITDILSSSGKRAGGVVSLPNASISLVSIFKNHEKCLHEVLQVAELCFSAKTEVEVELPAAAGAGGNGGGGRGNGFLAGGGRGGGGGGAADTDPLERPREVIPMSKEVRATVVERSQELYRTWLARTRKKAAAASHEYRLLQMNDVFWQIVHEAGPSSKEHLLVGRDEYRQLPSNQSFAFNFSFVERHDFPEALVADERVELAEDDPENTATVTGNLDDWGV